MNPITRATVTVTFLRMHKQRAISAPVFEQSFQVVRLNSPSVPFYRYIYNTVGENYLWWLRRIVPDDDLAALLRDDAISIYVLYRDGEPAGFFELDRRDWPDINLSYFGLMPQTIGEGIGQTFLSVAIEEIWRSGAAGITVNTCSADHHRALGNYLRVGFNIVRRVKEIWLIPDWLNMPVPGALRD